MGDGIERNGTCRLLPVCGGLEKWRMLRMAGWWLPTDSSETESSDWNLSYCVVVKIVETGARSSGNISFIKMLNSIDFYAKQVVDCQAPIHSISNGGAAWRHQPLQTKAQRRPQPKFPDKRRINFARARARENNSTSFFFFNYKEKEKEIKYIK